ncbi:hypothetical protein V6N13_098933 [Hibiscus sabdariffa]
MASNSFFNHLQDLDFTNEEQEVVFTPTIQWDSSTDDSDLLVIGKLISSEPIDDKAVIRAFQGIWKKEKFISITTVKTNYYIIKFPTEDIRNDILSRGPWTFKDEWLALATFNPNYNIDEYTFSSMNTWVRIFGISSILMDNDDIAHHTGNSLGAMIGKVIKVDTRRIDLNMVDYLRVGIILDVTKPVRRCVAIGGTSPSPKLCPIQYERLPTICYGCGIIGHNLDACTTFKLTPTSKLQYGDWIRYIPPRKQELNTRSKGSIRYLDGNRSINPKQPSNGQKLHVNQPDEGSSTLIKAATTDSSTAPTVSMGGNFNTKLLHATSSPSMAANATHGALNTKSSKQATATSTPPPAANITDTADQTMIPTLDGGFNSLSPIVPNNQIVADKNLPEGFLFYLQLYITIKNAGSTNDTTIPTEDITIGNIVARPPHETIINKITYPMESNLAAATMLFDLNITKFNSPGVMATKHTEGNNGVSSKDTTTLVATNTNVPIIRALKPQVTSSFGPNVIPTTNPFDESDGFIEFLANPTESNNEVPYLYDNMGLVATTMTTLPIPTEDELENDMGKSFLATSSMLIVFNDWISKATSSSAVLNDKESPVLTARGAKRRSSMQNDNKLKKPRPPPNSSKTRAGMSSIKNSPAEVEYQPRRGK